ncbi:MAG: site-2 protease family protein [Myxococcaceae bacterium]|nr:site-2 protease family protein [Myxococcaceae bacterium]
MSLLSKDRPWLHVALFFATGASVFITFLTQSGGGVESEALVDQLKGSAWFTASVMAILLAHELGHFVMARRHGVDSTWPFFIPLPLGFGTMGAVIRLRGRIPTRDALVDIGAGGPLAGLAVCVPLWALGVWLSRVSPAPDLTDSFPGQFSLWNVVAHWSDAAPSGNVVQVFGDNLLGLGLQRLIKGSLPAGHDLFAHPVLVAAWFGFLVTMLNLLPVGQLDGGHLTHAWFGRRAELIGRVVAAIILVASLLFSTSWFVWFVLVTFVVKFGHPPVVDDEAPLSRSRKLVCAACFLLTVLTFMPTPLRFATMPAQSAAAVEAPPATP